MNKNTAQLWDALWEKVVSKEADMLALAKEEHSIRWQRIEQIVLAHFTSFKALRVIEIGAGAGTNAALMAKRGAAVTLLDYSPRALSRAKEFFHRNALSATFVEANALRLPDTMSRCFDIAMSFGLTEHFKGPERLLINKVHFDLLRDEGLAFISVPNKYNLPYRIYKLIAETLGVWTVGEEYPYSRRELRRICREIGIEKPSFIGDSLLSSLSFVNPLPLMKRATRKLFGVQFREEPEHKTVVSERGTFLDAYASYALVLCGRKRRRAHQPSKMYDRG